MRGKRLQPGADYHSTSVSVSLSQPLLRKCPKARWCQKRFYKGTAEPGQAALNQTPDWRSQTSMAAGEERLQSLVWPTRLAWMKCLSCAGRLPPPSSPVTTASGPKSAPNSPNEWELPRWSRWRCRRSPLR
jgi:hypothetical protein